MAVHSGACMYVCMYVRTYACPCFLVFPSPDVYRISYVTCITYLYRFLTSTE